MNTGSINTYLVNITGLVQGVGFRPFIYLLATRMELTGCVENRTEGVRIKVNANPSVIADFIASIRDEAPAASSIENIDYHVISHEEFTDFSIQASKGESSVITEVSPDIAVCEKCLEDMAGQPHRISYPFINCTNCGPRFTIIRALPYDRKQTTMACFTMCSICENEYKTITDRRFHAQPVACNHCGPEYVLYYENQTITAIDQILNLAVKLLESGKIIAIKGLGGYHLACDAMNPGTVQRLRLSKKRESKPFALMFRDLDTASQYADISETAQKLLTSWRRPVVLLKQKQSLPEEVNSGLDSIGVMLPYLPLHYLLFQKLRLSVIVLTSGNLGDEPVIIDDEQAKEQLKGIYDAILVNNREIHNRADDSVVFETNGKEKLIRRSRGYAPASISLKQDVEGILATGAELKNCFCIGKGNKAILSQHIGDLKNAETYDFFTESIDRFSQLFRFKPELVVHDMHPAYLSTSWAMETGLPLMAVQHHHAHIASCMAENGLDENVIGVSLDGTGYGDDGHSWGGEFFDCNLEGYDRIVQFDYQYLPGGDKAIEEPWRLAVSCLYRVFGRDIYELGIPLLKDIAPGKIDFVIESIEKQINCHLSSGVGRLFDAVSALCGLCHYSTFEAEGPMRIESVIDYSQTGFYDFEVGKTIDTSMMFRQIVSDLQHQVKVPVISAKFHQTIIQMVMETVQKISLATGLKQVVLSGGIFQNRYIVERSEKNLSEKGFEVYTQQKVPSNDGGIALGQIAIAGMRRR